MNILGFPIDDEIVLSIVALEDAEPLFSLIDDSRVRLGKWLGFVADTKSSSDVAAFIAKVRAKFAVGKSYTFAIRYRGLVAGVISIVVDEVNNSGEVGYWLGAEFEGKLIVTRCVDSLLAFAFNSLLLHRIEIRVAVGNAKSNNVPPRCGFVFEGVMRGDSKVGDNYYDTKLYSRLATDEVLLSK
ncbi:MAG: GNAT family protein [Actinomycetota bacterium]|nr:GNAT family protein [Actinomycetota bacterium]